MRLLAALGNSRLLSPCLNYGMGCAGMAERVCRSVVPKSPKTTEGMSVVMRMEPDSISRRSISGKNRVSSSGWGASTYRSDGTDRIPFPSAS